MQLSCLQDFFPYASSSFHVLKVINYTEDCSSQVLDRSKTAEINLCFEDNREYCARLKSYCVI